MPAGKQINLRVQEKMGPEWILFGVKLPDCYMVFGSTELSYVELEAIGTIEETSLSCSFFRRFEPRLVTYEFRGRMTSYTVATGETYGQAIVNLFQHWDPDKKAPLGLPEGDTP